MREKVDGPHTFSGRTGVRPHGRVANGGQIDCGGVGGWTSGCVGEWAVV